MVKILDSTNKKEKRENENEESFMTKNKTKVKSYFKKILRPDNHSNIINSNYGKLQHK